MLDVNRALYLTGARHAEAKLASPNTYFQETLLQMCEVRPEKKLTENEVASFERKLDAFEHLIKRA